MEEIEKLVRELDIVITGKQPTGSPNGFDLDEWLFWGEAFYCSDGGYSRIYFSVDYGDIRLATVSTDYTKARWSDVDVCQLRAKIDKLARIYVLEEDPTWEFV